MNIFPGNSLEDEQLACKMVYLSKQINELKQYVEINNLERKTAKWTNADEIEVEEFPVLDEDQ